jgi:dTDP-glucose 4,6-dehydratase
VEVEMKLLVTGGAGFIGSNFIRYILQRYDNYKIINLDKLTYAGNLQNLRDIEKDPRYKFVHGDICDSSIVEKLSKSADVIVNFAAETHVDRAILEPSSFINTDVIGTYVLLESAKKNNHKRYIQISTDEVYGNIENGSFTEEDPLRPSNPYSASKGSGDLLAYSYWATYKVPIIITRSSNNFGPFQHPEKLIPLFITNAIDEAHLPLYGNGKNVRDWIYVLDNCKALDLVLHKGIPGEVYNIGGGNEKTNIEIAELILSELGKSRSLIKPVKDRLGHDRRYSLDSSKIHNLGFSPGHEFEEALRETINWYRDNSWWWHSIKDGEFKHYYKRAYV